MACLRAYMLYVPACLCARVFSMFACFMSLCAHIFYMLVVLKYLTCLRGWYPRLTDVWQGSKCSSKGQFKKYLINEGAGKFTKKKWWKMTQGVDVLPKHFCSPFFLVTQFSLLLISLIGSNNITVNNNKKYSKGYMCLWDSYTITSKSS